jgi:DMSO/TMAO reductase YedYZ molybdopterin-dependent catalytic subunit
VTTTVRPAKRYSEVQLLTAQLGAILTVMLGLQFISGALFYLYVFFYDAPPWFTFTRFIHFYLGVALIPVILAKYGSTGVRFAGYYLRIPYFKKLGPPGWLARLTAPLLVLDFALIGISGLYMLLHVYYAHTNIPPFEWKPVQTHAIASFLLVPLLGLHLGAHLFESARAVKLRRDELVVGDGGERGAYTRRGFLAGIGLAAVGLAWATQNTALADQKVGPFFIRQYPKGADKAQRFPIETLFGDKDLDPAAFRLTIDGAVQRPAQLSLDDLKTLPTYTSTIRTSCVSGWTSINHWTGYRFRDVLALAGAQGGAQSVGLKSATDYYVPWPLHRLKGDDALLATSVNGEPLVKDHGAPLRLIVPGYPGQDMVKQLVHITVNGAPATFSPDLDPRSQAIGCCGAAGHAVTV